MDRFLEGKTALVTGGSRGLGRATAIDLASCGALVAINYASNDHAASETLAAVESAGGQGFLVKCPLGSLDAAEALVSVVSAELTARTGNSQLDILVNNAGGGPVHSLESTTSPIFDRVLADNFSGAFFVTKVGAPMMRDGGRVIFVSSLGARSALPDYIVYACAKSAIETLTVVVAKVLGPRGITVNCLTPGMIESDANADLRQSEQLTQHLLSITPLGRIGVPEDFAGAVRALVSPAMSYVTGQHIEVSGGMGL